MLKLHPVLAPVKVALEIGRGATVELRQVGKMGQDQDLKSIKYLFYFNWFSVHFVEGV